MKIFDIVSIILMALGWFIAFATCTYFILAYGWEFIVWVFAVSGLMTLSFLAIYNEVKRH